MSEEIAIKVENLSKCYHIYDQPRHRLLQMLYCGHRTFYKEFWALKDVSFEIRQGETIGIIGKNGSGKSTLLQMICGTLNPTRGSILTKGRVAALLELGSGFNPEFTGCENIYTNAALLGLTREEIDLRYDQIVTFADIGDFINQATKTYSSGMLVRLAFSVIAHVDADILIIDEALAVGDAVFNQKCMRFLRKFKENGTLVFVSHDMGSVINLCERGIWLTDGGLKQIGNAKTVSEAYLQYCMADVYGNKTILQSLSSGRETGERDKDDEKETLQFQSELVLEYDGLISVNDKLSEANGWKTGAGEIFSIRLENEIGNNIGILQGGEMVRLVIKAVAHQDMEQPILGFMVKDRLGQDLFGENTLSFTKEFSLPMKAGSTFESIYEFQMPMLPNGQYSVTASLADGDLHKNIQHHWLHEALILNVSSSRVRWGLVGIMFSKVHMREIL